MPGHYRTRTDIFPSVRQTRRLVNDGFISAAPTCESAFLASTPNIIYMKTKLLVGFVSQNPKRQLFPLL
jgi:hypothetical protein